MPGTAAELCVRNPLDPDQNLRGGITYLRRQYDALEARVPEHFDRLAWAFASYNAGRGYVLRALGIAEMDAKGFHLPGLRWWSWEPSWRYLFHRQADVNGRWLTTTRSSATCGDPGERARAGSAGPRNRGWPE